MRQPSPIPHDFSPARTFGGGGYTLLELVLVLAILATLAAAAAPALSGFARGRRADDTARRFISLTRWAKTQAAVNGRAYRMEIDPSAGQWQITEQNDQGQFVPAASTLGNAYTIPDGVTLTADLPMEENKPHILFEPNGRCDSGMVTFAGYGGNVVVSCDIPIEGFRIQTAEAVHP